MNMRIKFLMAGALALMPVTGLWAQATKVAVIDMQRAIAESKEGKEQIAELDKKYTPKQAEFQRRSQEIQTKTEQLKKTANTISDDAKATQDAEITRLKTALQRDIDDASADSEADQSKLGQTVGGKIYQVVQKYAADNGFMIVFDLSSQPNNLICCASAPDITAAVIALFDKTNTGSAPAASAPAATTPKPAATAPRPPVTTAPRPGTPSK